MGTKQIAMRDALLEKIWQRMAHDETVFFVSSDFGSPVLDKIRSDFGERFINVGIAEQNLINVSAGLALEGFNVFSYAIAPFITMRCFEQNRVNLALLSEARKINVNLIGVGAGYSYVVSGPTHQCYEDITIMRGLPNFQIFSPSDHVTAGALMETCLENSGVKYLRLDAQILPQIYHGGSPDIKRGFYVHKTSGPVCLVATGYMLHTALQVSGLLSEKGLDVGVVDLFDLVGFQTEDLIRVLEKYSGIVTLEEGFRGRGGLDALFFEMNARFDLRKRMLNLGVEPNYSFALGTREELHEKVGIGPISVFKAVRSFLDTV